MRWGSRERCKEGWEAFLGWSRVPLNNGTNRQGHGSGPSLRFYVPAMAENTQLTVAV